MSIEYLSRGFSPGTMEVADRKKSWLSAREAGARRPEKILQLRKRSVNPSSSLLSYPTVSQGKQ
ncbi:hypothetical protein HMPREF1862_00288 [Varibaculum cambriense]|uniref:Uncharacterized protein n=1 Tax=Varibaculum cambriense TaxID=184870 RepID=A0AB34X1M0_9ACTO|nr:hypothetical protein HMPREF1862_00288 [Varibaculum cambriense]